MAESNKLTKRFIANNKSVARAFCILNVFMNFDEEPPYFSKALFQDFLSVFMKSESDLGIDLNISEEYIINKYFIRLYDNQDIYMCNEEIADSVLVTEKNKDINKVLYDGYGAFSGFLKNLFENESYLINVHEIVSVPFLADTDDYSDFDDYSDIDSIQDDEKTLIQ